MRSRLMFSVTLGLFVLLVLGHGVSLAQEKTKIQLSVWGMPWEDDIYTKYAIPQFMEKYPNVEVEFLRFENYWDILLTKHAAGAAPDVQRNLDERYGAMRLRGALLPLTEFIKKEGYSLDDFHEVALKALNKDGEIWGLPQDLSPRTGLYYNMKAFDEAGLPYPTAEWTIDDMFEAAKKLTIGQRPNVTRYGIAWLPQYGFIWAMLNFGGKIWDEQGRCIINSDACVEGAKFMQDIIYSGAAPTYAEVTVEAVEDLFKAEKVAMFLGGGWFIPAVTRDVPDLKFGVAPAPRNREGKRITVLGQCIFEISSQTKHPDIAWEFTKHLVSAEVLTDYWQRTWVAAPSRLSLVKDPEVYNKIIGIPGHVPAITDPEEVERKLGWMRDIILNGEFTTEYTGDFFHSFYEVYLREALDLLGGPTRMDPKPILDDVVQRVNEEIERFYQGSK